MLGNKKTFKAQSAMEYLMTYGWAILIIAVVLGALFSLGVFSGSSLLGTSCVASPGYLCSSPTLLTGGYLSFTFGQNTGSAIYNVELACAATANTNGLPINLQSWSTVNSATGVLYLYGANTVPVWTGDIGNSVSLVSGQTVSVSGLPCYSNTGAQLNAVSAPIGASFTGFVYLNYTSTQCMPPGSPCTWYTVKAATLTMKVV